MQPDAHAPGEHRRLTFSIIAADRASEAFQRIKAAASAAAERAIREDDQPK